MPMAAMTMIEAHTTAFKTAAPDVQAAHMAATSAADVTASHMASAAVGAFLRLRSLTRDRQK